MYADCTAVAGGGTEENFIHSGSHDFDHKPIFSVPCCDIAQRDYKSDVKQLAF